MKDRLASFEFETRDDVLVATVAGEIDSSNAAELRLALAERLPSTAGALILDLTTLTYLDSAGVHLLFDLGRRLAARRQALRLVVPENAATRRVLEMCAIDSIAPIDSELEASLSGAAASGLARGG